MLLYSSYLPPKDQDASTIRKSVVQAQELHKAATRDWKGLEGTGRDWKGSEGACIWGPPKNGGFGWF